MANFQLASASVREEWSNKYQLEYTRESGFDAYMGSADNSIIRMFRELGKKAGDRIHAPYFKNLTGAGVTGSQTLEGNEEALANYSTAIVMELKRNGVAVSEDQSFKTDLDIANVARGQLKNWSADKFRADLLTSFGSVIVAGGGTAEDTYVPYGTATATQKNNWMVANKDRILLGDTVVGTSQTVHATALATIAGTDTMSASMLNAARRAARATTNFRINPYRSDKTKGREWFVAFVGPQAYDALLNDEAIMKANTDARVRGMADNPVFQGGDLISNGVIIREIPEIGVISGAGSSGADLAPMYLCGAGALGVGYAKMTEPRVDTRDFGHVNAVGITEIRGQSKMSAAGVQTGMVTLYHAV